MNIQEYKQLEKQIYEQEIKTVKKLLKTIKPTPKEVITRRAIVIKETEANKINNKQATNAIITTKTRYRGEILLINAKTKAVFAKAQLYTIKKTEKGYEWKFRKITILNEYKTIIKKGLYKITIPDCWE